MEVLFSRSRNFLPRVQIFVFRKSLIIVLLEFHKVGCINSPCYYKNMAIICSTVSVPQCLLLEQAKRGTPKTSECTFILPLSCLLSCSIRLLSLSWARTLPNNLGYSLHQWLFPPHPRSTRDFRKSPSTCLLIRWMIRLSSQRKLKLTAQ